MIWEEKKIQNEKDSEFHIIQPTYLQHSFFFLLNICKIKKKKVDIKRETENRTGSSNKRGSYRLPPALTTN
jgi:hypothetical protein